MERLFNQLNIEQFLTETGIAAKFKHFSEILINNKCKILDICLLTELEFFNSVKELDFEKKEINNFYNNFQDVIDKYIENNFTKKDLEYKEKYDEILNSLLSMGIQINNLQTLTLDFLIDNMNFLSSEEINNFHRFLQKSFSNDETKLIFIRLYLKLNNQYLSQSEENENINFSQVLDLKEENSVEDNSEIEDINLINPYVTKDIIEDDRYDETNINKINLLENSENDRIIIDFNINKNNSNFNHEFLKKKIPRNQIKDDQLESIDKFNNIVNNNKQEVKKKLIEISNNLERIQRDKKIFIDKKENESTYDKYIESLHENEIYLNSKENPDEKFNISILDEKNNNKDIRDIKKT